jgi:hypothetical protein
MDQNNFIENEDFELRNVSELRPQGGKSNKMNIIYIQMHLKFV